MALSGIATTSVERGIISEVSRRTAISAERDKHGCEPEISQKAITMYVEGDSTSNADRRITTMDAEGDAPSKWVEGWRQALRRRNLGCAGRKATSSDAEGVWPRRRAREQRQTLRRCGLRVGQRDRDFEEDERRQRLLESAGSGGEGRLRQFSADPMRFRWVCWGRWVRRTWGCVLPWMKKKGSYFSKFAVTGVGFFFISGEGDGSYVDGKGRRLFLLDLSAGEDGLVRCKSDLDRNSESIPLDGSDWPSDGSRRRCEKAVAAVWFGEDDVRAPVLWWCTKVGTHAAFVWKYSSRCHCD
ncbi:hypothetical protein ACLOJK_014179 [Asimina triloba]